MTTPVGSIKVDLTIDGSGAPKAVADALKPALNDISKTGSVAGSGFIKQLSEAVDAGVPGLASSLSGISGSASRALAAAGLSAGSEFMGGLTSAIASSAPGVGSALSGVESALGGVGGKAALTAAGIGSVFAVVATAAAVAGRALYDLGERYDGIYDGIAARTGATEAQMESLQQSVRNVGNTTADSLESIGDIVGRVSQSMQLTGGELEAVTKQIADFQRITGEGIDVRGLKDVVRAFDIDPGQTSETLDTLARMFQMTGTSVNTFEQALAAAAPAAKSLGLDFDETARMLVQFDQAGLNADRTYVALTNAAKVFADNNIDLKTGLADTITQLDGFIDSGNEAAAIDLAGKVFGERNAQKFVELIRQGKLGVDDLNRGWLGTDDAIRKATDQTADLAENWDIIKNRVSNWASDLAGPVFAAVNKVLGAVIEMGDEVEKFPGAAGDSSSAALGGLLGAPVVPAVPVPLPGEPGFIGPVIPDLSSDPSMGGVLMLPPGMVTSDRPAAAPPQDIAAALDSDKKDAKEPSTKERRDQIGAGLDPSLWQVDLGSIPGGVGQPPMQVAVTNLPAQTGIGPGYAAPGIGGGGFPWDVVAQYESSGNWANPDTGRNGHYGGLQFSPETWRAFGGDQFAPMPHLATRDQQIEIANRTAFTGWNGSAPQGLGAWEVITKGLTASNGITVNSKPGDFGGVGAAPVLGSIPQVAGTDPAISALAAIAKQRFGLDLTSGLRDWAGTASGTSFHLTGEAGDFSNGSGNTAQQAQFAAWLRQNFAPYLSELIYSDPSVPGVSLNNGAPFDYGSATNAEHENHVHVAIREQMQQQFLAALAGVSGSVPSISQSMFGAGAPGGGMGYFQVDQQAVIRAQQDIQKRAEALEDARRERVILEHDNLATEQELEEARRKERNADWDLQNAKADLAEKERGTFKSSSQQKTSLSYKDFPLGDPRRALAGVLGGIGVPGDEIGALLGAAGGPLGQLAGDVAATVGGFPLPGPLGYGGTPTSPVSSVSQLADEGNPLFLAQAAGINVPDFTRTGGGPSAQNLDANGGLPNDATGRIYSDTAALIDRTFTNLDAADKARHDQVMAVLNEVRDRLSAELLGPVVESSVTGGINGMGSGTSEAIGAAMGNSAGPIIASAVASASGGGGGGEGAALVNTAAQAAAAAGQAATTVNSGGFHSFDFDSGGGLFAPLPFGHGPLGNLYDQGGLWPSGTFGTNLSGHPERVLDPDQTRLFDAGLLGGWNLQPQQQHFAAAASVTGGVDVSSTVGAEWMGVSQLPIISAIANLLVAVLLKVIGVQIQARDTLDEISSEFRDFRGDFRAFDAAGRVLNDTSGLVDRTGTSEQEAVDERVRILKQVLEGLLQFLIEKIIVPISKAVANTAINIGSQLASGAISGGIGAAMPAGGSVVGGMVGSMVGSAISSAGSATVDIVAEVGTILAESLISVGLEAIGSLFQSYLPDLASTLFSGAVPAAIFDPIGQFLTGALGGVTGALSGLFGGLASLIPGLPFDDGGVAVGMGLLPKATIAPERVLSPRQTVAFERLPDALLSLVDALERGGSTPTSKTVHAPITVTGGPQVANQIADRLVKLL